MTLITGQTLPSKFEEIPNFVNNAFTNYQNVILFLCDAGQSKEVKEKIKAGSTKKTFMKSAIRAVMEV